MRMLSAQIRFVADDKLDVLGDEINTVSRLNRVRTSRNTRIDFNDDWATLRPPEFNVRWPPTKIESSQTVQRNIGDARMLVISQRGWEDALTEHEMRRGPKLAAAIAINSSPIIWAQ